ncbi:Rqc2 family fibronectin-binding protein [Effusibacillus pohliae]|uniref:Rqc2 family fibronectin-binding protein n=1 Tax=Effusibacillus pohliae TaxID=232270 RepID=UPI000374E79D|nr:NFACT RNA binding domain-containing protein [Effusibacillus pohliae]
MAFDGIVLRAVAHELQQTIAGGRVDKIYQPLARDLLLIVRNQGRNYRLLISANPTFPRIHLAERYKGQNPVEPPMFCMLLRKHLEGGRITKIEQVDNERILLINVENRDELGDLGEKQLVVEIMGRHSNIILVDPQTGRILDGIVHVNLSTSRHREVLPGRTYVAPPEQDKISPFAETKTGFLAKRQTHDGPFDKFLVNHYSGISPLLGRELAHRFAATETGSEPANTRVETGERSASPAAEQPDASQLGASQQDTAQPDAEQEWRIFESFLEPLLHHRYSPTLVIDRSGKPKAFSAVRLTHVPGDVQEWDSISACLEQFFEEKSWRDTLRQKAGDMERILLAELEKDRSKIAKFEEAITEAAEADRYRIWGELLTASLFQLEKGQTEANVVNYFEEDLPEITIPLDPQLSPQENAQAYFKKYNKVKKSIPILEQQIAQTRERIAYLESVLQSLSTADLGDLEEIREELEQVGVLKAARKPGGKKKPAASQPERFRSSDGIDIYVGKNNKQNDYLTMKLAHSSDTWLHTKDIPGSHVVIRAKDVPETTLREAAQLAAYFSKARDSSHVPVDYTLVKNVWKPNGAKPGMVLYEGQKTLYVTPDAALVAKLKTT